MLELAQRVLSTKKETWIKVSKVTIVFIVPLFFTLMVGFGEKETYEFMDEENARMVAPANPLPYLSDLTVDLFSTFGVSWYSFCIENLSYSQEQELPHDLAFRLEGQGDFTKIQYTDTACKHIHDKDIFYEVAWGGFEIPSKERAFEIFDCDGKNCVVKMDIEELMNFNIYSKLNFLSFTVIYILFVAAIYGLLSVAISIYRYMKKDSFV